MPKSGLTDITVVLDRSGSMKSIADDTIGGMNRFVADQKALPGDATLTLVQFDHEYSPIHRAIPIRDVPDLTNQTFVPRGTTALLDAIGRAIVETGERLSATDEHDRPSVVIFVVMTDGMENDSHEYTRSRINAMISHQRDTYAWQFLFLGANQDAIRTAEGMGIQRTSALSYAANPVGTSEAFVATSRGVAMLRSGSRCAVYCEADRKKQRAQGAV